MKEKEDLNPVCRRQFIKQGGLIIAAAAAGESLLAMTGCVKKEESEEERVAPAEDLMQEHGLLSRVLLIYDEVLNRIMLKAEFPPEVLKNSADIIKEFIEDYHEKNEENYIFPRMQKAGKLTDLVAVLKSQHEAGRALTQYIQNNAKQDVIKNDAEAKALSEKMKSFIRMYRPHKSREDTILFPGFRKLLPPKEYDTLGDNFEKIEHDKFGEDGFERYVDKVANLEKQLGIEELGKFSPAV